MIIAMAPRRNRPRYEPGGRADEAGTLRDEYVSEAGVAAGASKDRALPPCKLAR
jgi:hypothetical protein